MLKISIITVSFNSSKTIKETIESVIKQDYPSVEYIIIDGSSIDGTQRIVESFGSQIDRFISEKDKGLYDAMNKGIDLATGDIIGILNSDDIYSGPHVLSRVISEFENGKIDCVFGDLYYFKTSNPNKVIRLYSGKNFTRNKVKFGMMPPHPTFFVKRNIYAQYGKFDIQYKYAADFDLMARFLYCHSISYSYIPITMVKMRLGGLSTIGFSRLIEINNEDIRSCKKNRIPTNFLIFHIKYFFKIFHIRSIMGLLKRN